MTRKEKLAMWRARRLAAKAAEEEAADAERQVCRAEQKCRLMIACLLTDVRQWEVAGWHSECRSETPSLPVR